MITAVGFVLNLPEGMQATADDAVTALLDCAFVKAKSTEKNVVASIGPDQREFEDILVHQLLA